MIYKKLSYLQKTLAIALTVVGAYGSLPLPSLAAQIQSELSTASTTILERANQLSFLSLQVAQARTQQATRRAANPFKTLPLLKDRGAPAPGKRIGGASRGVCPKASKSLTALVPEIPTTPTDSVFALTFADHPTFWFYFPFPSSPARSVEFMLQDDKGNEVYKTSLSESGTTPGVVGFKLPDTVRSLEVNKRYKWYFTIYCDSTEPSDMRFVSGWVQRVPLDPSLQRQLEQGTTQQKVLLYTEVGVWHEAVTALAELRRQNPKQTNLKKEWDKLLQAADLDAIAQEPITSMLTPKK